MESFKFEHYFSVPHTGPLFARNFINFRVFTPLLKSPLTSLFWICYTSFTILLLEKNLMKKLVAVLMCLMMVLSLASCDFNRDPDDLSQNEDKSESDVNDDNNTNGNTDSSDANDNSENDTVIPQHPEAEIAMQAYQAAINDEICVVDENLGEIKLKDCRFPSDNVRLGDCEILYKAILDMDGDGLNEYVIQSETKDHIVLRYYNGKVYSYCFESNDFFNLNNDGSFYWIDSYELDNCTRGYNRIDFDGSSCRIKELYRIKQTSRYDYGDSDHEYYVDGKQITREEFQDYYDSYCRNKRLMTFSPLDISCEYPISSEKACEIASNYWGVKSGMEDGAAGSTYVSEIIVLEKPNNDTQSYHIGCQWAGYTNHVIDDFYAQTPDSVRISKELIVDAITGKVSVLPSNKISYADAVLLAQEYWANIFPEDKGYIIESGYNSMAPSDVYVVLVRGFVLDHWSTIDEIWIDKNTGAAIVPYDGK